MKIHPTLIDVYETENSTYEVDIRQALYRRTAKGREVVQSHRLTYGEWHPLKTVSVVDDPYGSGKKGCTDSWIVPSKWSRFVDGLGNPLVFP